MAILQHVWSTYSFLGLGELRVADHVNCSCFLLQFDIWTAAKAAAGANDWNPTHCRCCFSLMRLSAKTLLLLCILSLEDLHPFYTIVGSRLLKILLDGVSLSLSPFSPLNSSIF